MFSSQPSPKSNLRWFFDTLTSPSTSSSSLLRLWATLAYEGAEKNGVTDHHELLFQKKIYLNYLDVSKNRGTPKIMNFNRVFHSKPSILGHRFKQMQFTPSQDIFFVDFVDFSFYYRNLEGLVLNAWDFPPKSAWQKNPHTVATQMITISLLFCLFQKKIGSSIRFFFVFYAVIICWRSDSTAGTHWRSQILLSLFIGEQYKISVREQYKIHDPCPIFFQLLVSAKKETCFQPQNSTNPKSPLSFACSSTSARTLFKRSSNSLEKNSKQLGVAWRIQLGSTTSLEATVRINILDHWFCKFTAYELVQTLVQQQYDFGVYRSIDPPRLYEIEYERGIHCSSS